MVGWPHGDKAEHYSREGRMEGSPYGVDRTNEAGDVAP